MGIDGQSWLTEAKRFWAWWLSELRNSIPSNLVALFAREKTELLIHVSPDAARIELNGAGESRLLSSLDLLNAADEELAAQGQGLLSSVPPQSGAIVCLEREFILEHCVLLPQATEANLSSVLNFELDRLTPFKHKQACFGHKVLNRYPEHEKIQVCLALCRAEIIERILNRLAIIGIVPTAVYPAGEHETGKRVPSMNMLHLEQRPLDAELFDEKTRKLAVASGILFVLALAFPAWQLGQTRNALEARIDEIRTEASRVSDKQVLLVSRFGAQDAIADRKNNQPSKLEILAEITRLLPDNTWVSQLVVNDRSVSLQGESQKASDLIEVLEKSNYFQNVRFDSSVIRNPSTNMERYEIGMELVPQ